MQDHQQLDARGLVCPLPVLKARKLLLSLPKGARLEILATDAKAPADFILFCDEAGHRLLASESREGVFYLTVERG